MKKALIIAAAFAFLAVQGAFAQTVPSAAINPPAGTAIVVPGQSDRSAVKHHHHWHFHWFKHHHKKS